MRQIKLLNSLKRLSCWLQNYQLRINDIQFRNNEIVFQHPLKGKTTHLVDKKIFYVEGITFYVKKGNCYCLDNGAILDPRVGRVIIDHYATSHAAVLWAILAKKTKDNNYKDMLFKSLDYLITIKGKHPFSKVKGHWEFDNFATVVLFELGIKDKKFINFIKKAPYHYRPFSTNWKIQLIAFLIFRIHKLNKWSDIPLFIFQYNFVKKAILPDGCIEDVPGRSRSLQYHAFSLAVLIWVYKYFPSQTLYLIILKGLDYLASFVSPEGDFNYKGRGQKQIFGYASAIYAFLAGARITKDKTRKKYFVSLASKICDFLIKHQDSSGVFPLVLGHHLDSTVGWYEYNYLSVYNAFAGAWLALALNENKNLEVNKYNINEINTSDINITFHYDSQTVIVKTSKYFLCVSGGEEYHSTDCGLAPHYLWFKGMGPVISSPGGPDESSYEKLYAISSNYKNYNAPLFRISKGRWFGPCGNKGILRKIKSRVFENVIKYSGCNVIRRWNFDKSTIFVEDIIINKNMFTVEARIFNIPILLSSSIELVLVNKGVRIKNKNAEVLIILEAGEKSVKIEKTMDFTAGKTCIIHSPIRNIKPGETFLFRYRWEYK